MKIFKSPKALGFCAIVVTATVLGACANTVQDTHANKASSLEKSLEARVQDTLYGYDANIKLGQYEVKSVNLNDDGMDDAVALMHFESGYCGNGGCALMTMIADPDNHGKFKLVGDTSLVKQPILKSANSTHGLSDILVWVSGGGYPAAQVVLKYDGQKYTDNASVALENDNSTDAELLFGP
ncbi:hypothetical protein HPQ32_18245 [Photobacterium carnosum]|uniref:hypothetical protein n=1 Tax=Photobacterium carnosum TaxID=2023717 RepID=UPI001C927A25|nr:hypothetical protein [Photobacterium carnosum]MBY3790334.1 hypothetical protein [Photobacterium carnosum]MCD9496398.1 hypothetical protein [Photobacterium carnosum]MCD9535377.1 hypothetical protein [Photobacterium carnosum]